MPRWTSKDERQYEKIRQSSLGRGKGERRSEEIAARTVNKQRRKEGRTPRQTTQGTGKPQRRLQDRTKRELYNRARQLHIPGRSRMDKGELVLAIRQAE